MSLLRPRWLEDLLPPLPASSTRLRNLKGFDPQQIVAFNDPLFADDPLHWQLGATLAAGGATFFSKIGLQMPNDDAVVGIVDGLLASTDVADQLAVDVGILALVTDTSVVLRNRRESSRGALFERAGPLRIVDNTNTLTGTNLLVLNSPASTPVLIPLGYRMFGGGTAGGEQLFVRTGTSNLALRTYMWGRLTRKGAR